MRIIAGKFKGRSIMTPRGHKTRPTSVVTRRTMFDILSHAHWVQDIESCNVLDAFAGTGSLGLEALSRGARYCSFTEIDKNAHHCIRDTLEIFGLTDSTDLFLRSILKFDSNLSGNLFDLVFIDPPYRKNLVEKTLAHLTHVRCLSDKALAVVEMSHNEEVEIDSGWKIRDGRTIGASQLYFLSRVT